MVNSSTDTILRDIDGLFRLGVVSGMSDGELLERLVTASGCDRVDELAFDAIVRRYGPMVLGVCLRVLGDYHAAEDAFQATFLVLALRARSVRRRESLGPWLHGVAARIARRSLILSRKRRESPILSSTPVEPAGHDPGLADLNAILDEELSRLPDKYRLPMILCYLEGQTQEEAARKLGWSKGTVSGRLARAKDLLRGRLSRRGLAPTAGILTVSLTPRTASAALVIATVRAAVAASLGLGEAALVTGRVTVLVRDSIKWMSLWQLGSAAARVLALGVGTAAIATPMLMSGSPEPRPADIASPVVRAARLDRSGDPLPPRVRLRLGTTQRRHPTEAVGVAFAPDGKAVVSARADGFVHFWDSVSGKRARTIDLMGDGRTPDQSIREFTASDDGRFMAAIATDHDPATQSLVQSVWIRSMADGRPVRTIAENARDISGLALSPDGAILATGATSGEVRLWDVSTGACRSTLRLDLQSVPLLVFAPDGKTLAISALGSKVTLWEIDRQRGTPLTDLVSGPDAPCFSPDGRSLAVNLIDGRAVIVSRATGRSRIASTGVAHAFAPDGRSLAMTGAGGELRVIDTNTGNHSWETDLGFGLGKTGVVFSPDGRTIVASKGGVSQVLRRRVRSRAACKRGSAQWRREGGYLHSRR